MALTQIPVAYEKALTSDLTVERKTARWSYEINCLGVYTEGDALAAALTQASPILSAGGFTLQISRTRVKQLGPDAWCVTVDYEPLDEDDDKNQPNPEPGTWKFSWNTAGGTHKITQAEKDCETRYQESPWNPAPDLKGVIGWDGKKAAGTDIVVPKLEFSITLYKSPAEVNMNLVKNLARNTGKTNKTAWLGFDAGELLFLGSRGDADLATMKGQRVKPVSIQLDFAASENTTDIKIGEITVASKKGWQYLWVFFEQKTDSSVAAKPVVPRAIWAYVDTVYKELDFAALFGFGGA